MMAVVVAGSSGTGRGLRPRRMVARARSMSVARSWRSSPAEAPCSRPSRPAAGSCGCSVSASAARRRSSWRCSLAGSSWPWKGMFELGRRPRVGSARMIRCERAQRKNTRRACSWRARLAGLAMVARNASRSLAVVSCLWVPTMPSPHATCEYSWRRPPSRSRLRTRMLSSAGAMWVLPSGGFWFSARCGRWLLLRHEVTRGE